MNGSKGVYEQYWLQKNNQAMGKNPDIWPLDLLDDSHIIVPLSPHQWNKDNEEPGEPSAMQ